MAAKKKAKESPPRKRAERSDKKGFIFVGARLSPRLNNALGLEARRRAALANAVVIDKSAIVREALELHPDLKKHLK